MSRFADLSLRLQGRDAKPDPEDPETPAPEKPDEPEGEPETSSKPKEPVMADETPLEQRDDYKAGLAAGEAATKAVSDRMNTVFAHADAKGREAHAARLLGTSMSAEEIIAELPNYPVASVLSKEEQEAAAEEGGRKAMQEQMNGAGNADLGDEADGNGAPQSKSSRILAAQAKATGRKPASKE